MTMPRCLIVAALLAVSTATVAAGPPAPAELEQPGVHAGLELSGCNRAMQFAVTRIEVADQIGEHGAPPGHRWLVLDVAVDNRMPADLMFDLDYAEQLLVASLSRQMYLLVDDSVVSRSIAELNTLEDGFILSQIGEARAGRVVYPVPDDGIESLSLRYYHDQYAPVIIDLAAREAPPADDPDDGAPGGQRNQALELAVFGHRLEPSWHDIAAPEGMQWLVVDLRGRSRWTLPADALAIDRDADVDGRIELPKAMEYVEATGLLQAVVDGRHGYTRDRTLGTLPGNPALLPETHAGGLAVFPVPIDAGSIELVAHFPQFRGEGLDDGVPEAMRFALVDSPVPAPEPPELIVFADDPTPLTVHEVARIDGFAGHRAGDGRALLRIDASMKNVSATGGMMSISDRLSLTAEGGPAVHLVGAWQRGPLDLAEPFWLPAGGEPRAFVVVFDMPADTTALDVDYAGVSVNASERLRLDAL